MLKAHKHAIPLKQMISLQVRWWLVCQNVG